MAAARPLVSVILPTLNRARMLERSAGSVLRQSWRDLELVVVDDGSTEDIAAVVRGFGDPRARCVRRPRNGGVAAARNTGIEAARGRYLAFQDSDDEWLLDKLALQLEDLQPLDETTMSVCGLVRLLPGRAPDAMRLLGYPRHPNDWDGGLDQRGVLASAVAYTQTWLAPAEAVREAGGFDARLRILDDWELLVRLASRLRLRTRVQPLVISSRGGGSLSEDPSRFAHDFPLIVAKHAAALAPYPVDHAELHFLSGLWLSRAGRHAEALAQLRHSLRYRPLQARVLRLMARTLAQGRP